MIHKSFVDLRQDRTGFGTHDTHNRNDKGERYLKNIDTSSSVNILRAVGFEDRFGQSVSMIYLPLSHFALCVYLIC